MIPEENDPLIEQLLELVKELDPENIPVILGGGMSLYLRHRFLSERIPRYPFDVGTRSTADLDLFLSAQLIVDAARIESLKQAITRLGYAPIPEARNFQFAKEVKLYGQPRKVKIDLLAAPPRDADKGRVEISKPRIKPRGAEGIHAYLTPEAEGIEFGKISVDTSRLNPSVKLKNEILFIPSSFNYLILKLHAFRDQKNKPEDDYGRHHAFDIFATVARMGPKDWENARKHLAAHRDREYMKSARAIQREDFSESLAVGLIRLRESPDYRREAKVYDTYLETFIQDMADLFST